MSIYQDLANIKVDRDLKKNENVLKETFRDANDMVFRNMKVGQNEKLKILLFYVDGMTTKDSISEYAIQTLMESIDLESFQKSNGIELENKVLQTNIAIT